MDVHDKLDELSAAVANARSMPMTSSCIVSRPELLALVEEVRRLLPEELRLAQSLLADREAVLDDGRREATQLVSEARKRRDTLTSETVVVSDASRRADEIRAEALEQAETLLAEVDEYVETKLATFEVVLEKTLAAVARGRERLGRQRPDAPRVDGAVEHSAHPLDEDFGPT